MNNSLAYCLVESLKLLENVGVVTLTCALHGLRCMYLVTWVVPLKGVVTSGRQVGQTVRGVF